MHSRLHLIFCTSIQSLAFSLSPFSMATSSLQQKMDSELEPSLNLDLSLGGLFSLPKSPNCNASFSSLNLAASCNNEALLPSGHSSNLDNSSSSLLQNPHQFVDWMQDLQSHTHPDSLKRRIKGLHSEEIKQQKRARRDQEHSIKDHDSSFLCNSSLTNSGNLCKVFRKPTDNHELSSLQSDIRTTRGYDVHLVPSSAGSHSSSIELENGDNLDEESTSKKVAEEREVPRSRCGSNSDMIGLMGLSTATPSTSTMMYTHPFAMLPVQGLFPTPIQWGYTLPYAVHYSSLVMPPNGIPSVPDSASGLPSVSPPCIPSVAEFASCNEDKLQDNQETSSKKDALACCLALRTMPLSKTKKVQAISQKEELPPAMVNETSVSDVCTSAASSRPLCFMSPNDSSDVCASSWQASIALTSPTANYSSDSHKQVDPVKPVFANKVGRSSSLKSCSSPRTLGGGVMFPHTQVDRLRASISSLSQEGCLKAHCPEKSNGVGPAAENNMCGQGKHSISPGRKPTKTVRFSSDEKELVKCISNEDQGHASSSLLSKSGRICKRLEMGKACKSQLANKLQTSEALHKCTRYNGGIAERATHESDQEEGSTNSRITSESSDQSESTPLKVEAAGRLEGRHAANLPQVSTTCAGPNGKTIHGVMYITKNKQACLICSCHGTHMSPSEFVQHSGSTDLRNPERSIVVTGFSSVKQVM